MRETLPVPFTLSVPFLPLEVGPLNPAGGFGERCKLPLRGLGRSPSRNRIWCILALKYDSWWLTILTVFVTNNLSKFAVRKKNLARKLCVAAPKKPVR